MNEERLLDLLTKKAIYGLDESENRELVELESMFSDWKQDESFDLAAAAINLVNLDTSEPMPGHLQAKILADADKFFASQQEKNSVELQKTFEFEPKKPFWNWLGWAVAGFACVALGVSLWSNLQQPKTVEVVKIEQPKVLSLNEQFESLLKSGKDLKQVSFSNPTKPEEIIGDVVWSDTEQKGFMRFKELAVNNVQKETYQLWIFDETQDEKTPIDGGVFDINENREVIIPIDAKLKVKNPKLFAVTVEKPGGVVVSKREKIVAVAKISA